jgi:hypothetical protein
MRNFNILFKSFVLLLVLGTAVPGQNNKKPLAGYTAIVVEKFTVEHGKETVGFPEGEEAVLQKSAISRFRQKQTFPEIIDGSETAASTESANGKRVTLSGTIVGFEKGNRAKRYLVGFGAGATKIKVRLVFRDAESKQELLSVDREGKFTGMFNLVGGSGTQAMSDVANDVIDGLIKEINKNR